MANGHVNTTLSSSTSILNSVRESVHSQVHTPIQTSQSRFHINPIVAGTGDKSELVHTLCTLLHAYIIQHSYYKVCISVSGAQLQSSVERPCPGERVTFTCTIPSNGHQWDIPFLNISRALLPRDQGRVFSDAQFQFTVTEVVMATSIKSTATVTVTTELNGTLVVCRDGIGMLPDQSSIINIIGENGAYTVIQL